MNEQEKQKLQAEVDAEAAKIEAMSPEAREQYLEHLRDNAKEFKPIRIGANQVLSLDELLEPGEIKNSEPTDDEPEADPDISDRGRGARRVAKIGPNEIRENYQWLLAYDTASALMKFTLKQMIYFVLSRIMRISDAKIARMEGMARYQICRMHKSIDKIFEKSLGK